MHSSIKLFLGLKYDRINNSDSDSDSCSHIVYAHLRIVFLRTSGSIEWRYLQNIRINTRRDLLRKVPK